MSDLLIVGLFLAAVALAGLGVAIWLKLHGL